MPHTVQIQEICRSLNQIYLADELWNKRIRHGSVILSPHRGLSSTVRKCISRETGQEFAVKIIDKSQDSSIIQCIEAEVETLTNLPSHPNISK